MAVVVPHMVRSNGKRVALVIGNSNYAQIGPLDNPINDSVAMSAMLSRLGFDLVGGGTDLDRKAMTASLKAFRAAAKSSEMALLYFAGHGVEAGGTNFLLPVDFEATDAEGLRLDALRLDDVLENVTGASLLRLVILDACRNNPLARRLTGLDRMRSVGAGLARPEPIDDKDDTADILVAYAAEHGTEASDGRKGDENSPYAAALLKHLPTPNEDIRLLFGHVRDEVRRLTEGRQTPYLYGTFGGKRIILNSATELTASPSDSVRGGPDEAILVRQLRNELAYSRARRDNTLDAYDRFLAAWPDGDLAERAKTKRAAIAAAEAWMPLKEIAERWSRKDAVADYARVAAPYRMSGEKEQPLSARKARQQMIEDARALCEFRAAHTGFDLAAKADAVLATMESAAWQAARTLPSRAAYQAYIKNWPKGAHRDAALAELAGAGDVNAWESAQKGGSLTNFEQYLANWGDEAVQAAQARAKIAILEAKAIKKAREEKYLAAGLGFAMLLIVISAGYWLVTSGLPLAGAKLSEMTQVVRRWIGAPEPKPRSPDPQIVVPPSVVNDALRRQLGLPPIEREPKSSLGKSQILAPKGSIFLSPSGDSSKALNDLLKSSDPFKQSKTPQPPADKLQ